nr:uncharacterized protein LOC120974685 [Aegilops tauschii subsp. strangulata]
MDYGRRLLGCQYEDFRACEYVKWIDPRWDGRAKTIICDLAMKNKLLQEELEKKEAEKHCDREKKVIARINKEQMMCIHRILVLAISMCVGLCVILLPVAGKN